MVGLERVSERVWDPITSTLRSGVESEMGNQDDEACVTTSSSSLARLTFGGPSTDRQKTIVYLTRQALRISYQRTLSLKKR